MFNMMKVQELVAVFAILLTVSWAACAAPQPSDTNGLLLNFRDAPLRAVLSYLSDKADLIVVSEADVQGAVTLTASQPVSTAEAIGLLNDQLSRNHYTAVLDGRTLTVMDASRARTDAMTPVITFTNPSHIPVNNQIVTEILPVHSLNAAQLVKDLEPLIPSDDTVTANEAGNAVLMTACQKDIHRMAAIITALDSTAVTEVNVFALNSADAKSVAAELKELFQNADSDVNRAIAPISPGPRFGGRAGGDGGGAEKVKTAPARAVFVADEQMNAVAASAPPDIMPMIARVISLFDKPGQEVTGVEIFTLLHADPEEVVDEIASLFAPAPPSGTGTPEPTAQPRGFQFGGPGLLQAAPSRASTESSRLKRQAAVRAVADRRTQSVMVAASENALAQIRKIVARLDQGSQGVMRLSVYAIDDGDAGTALEAMTTLFASSSSTANRQAQITTPDGARYQAGATSQATSATSGVSGSSGSAGGLH
jgi:type II secretory pathway component GspD/PulD (secretin)